VNGYPRQEVFCGEVFNFTRSGSDLAISFVYLNPSLVQPLLIKTGLVIA